LLNLGSKLNELIKIMEIKGGTIVLYCKTRWTTAFRSVDDVIRLKAVLENVCKSIFLMTIINCTITNKFLF
jgi:hypothetical protein